LLRRNIFCSIYLLRTVTEVITLYKLLLSLILILPTFSYAQLSLPNQELIEEQLQNQVDDASQASLDKVQIIIPVEGMSDTEQKCLFILDSDQSQGFYAKTNTIFNQLNNFDGNNCSLLKAIDLPEIKNNKKAKWNFSFEFAFNRTNYSPTTMELKSSRIDVTIKDFDIAERTSAGFYNPANWESAMDSLRWIDEPTNSFILTAEKNGHNIIITAFHPKFLKDDNFNKHVTGIVDGIPVDGIIDVNEEFDGYNNQLGEMFLVRFENTHMQMQWTVGYGYDFSILTSKIWGKLSIRPSIHVGIMTGENYSVYVKEGEYWEFDDNKDNYRIQGAVVAAGLRLNYKYKRFNIFVEGQLAHARLKHGFMDGTARYDLNYQYVTFGIGYQLTKR
jgi:hypothetical protein